MNRERTFMEDSQVDRLAVEALPRRGSHTDMLLSQSHKCYIIKHKQGHSLCCLVGRNCVINVQDLCD